MDTSAEWMRKGSCQGSDQRIFFPEQYETTEVAKAICAECPVQEQCLGYALTTHQDWGVWGGKSERQRRRLRQKLKMNRNTSRVYRGGLTGQKGRRSA